MQTYHNSLKFIIKYENSQHKMQHLNICHMWQTWEFEKSHRNLEKLKTTPNDLFRAKKTEVFLWWVWCCREGWQGNIKSRWHRCVHFYRFPESGKPGRSVEDKWKADRMAVSKNGARAVVEEGIKKTLREREWTIRVCEWNEKEENGQKIKWRTCQDTVFSLSLAVNSPYPGHSSLSHLVSSMGKGRGWSSWHTLSAFSD